MFSLADICLITVVHFLFLFRILSIHSRVTCLISVLQPFTHAFNKAFVKHSLRTYSGGFLGSPVAKTLYSLGRDPGFNPWLGNNTPRANTKGLHATMKTEDPGSCNEDPVQPNK